ncbi:MAG: DUF1295 domain-containing protein [Anaerolineae bacterium]|jgi:protein-S-isoprenylcysteine O-methyltransferase Ste14|nr:DUF1295 domain-containing protein [Anaerolineae bacterium]
MIPVLFALFLYALVHSLLAGTNAKALIRKRMGERAYHGFYRLLYNLFAVITLFPINLLFVAFPQVVWTIDAPMLLMIVQGIGVIGVVISLVQIDLGRFLGVRQAIAYFQDEPLPLPDEPLQMGGIYRLVRHPLYLFSLMVIFAVPVMTEGYLAFAVGVAAYFILGSLIEEGRLVAAYGESYEQYRARVAWLIPFIRLPTVRKK